MTKPIFGESGDVVGWLLEQNIYDLAGWHTAVVNGENVHGPKGRHLGVFKNGLFRNHEGEVAGFMDGAQGGPILPVRNFPPMPPKLSLPGRAPAEFAKPPLPAIPSFCWASWYDFVTQAGEPAATQNARANGTVNGSARRGPSRTAADLSTAADVEE